MTDLQYEKQIVESAKANPERFGKLYDKYIDKVYRYVYRRVNDVANTEDIVSKTFYDAVKNLPSYQWKGLPFVCWLYTIARNNVTDWYRKNNRLNIVSIDEEYTAPIVADQETPRTELSKQELQEEIRRTLELLDEEEREIIILKYFEELSNKEIATVMDMSPNHVGVKLFRALKKLRTKLTHHL